MIYTAWQQFFILSIAMAGGFAVAALFDAAEAIRLLLHLPKRKITDLLLWLLAAGLFFWLWLILFAGAFRLLYFLWLGIGFAVYWFVLANPLRRLARKKAKSTSPIITAVRILGRGDRFLIAFFGRSAKQTISFFKHNQRLLQGVWKVMPFYRKKTEK